MEQKISAEELLAQYAKGERNFEGIDLEEADLFEAKVVINM